MLCTWAVEHDVTGVGVDISEVFFAAARRRADDLEVSDRITLVHADAARYVTEAEQQFDVVSCLGATWIGDGLVGTLGQMRPRVKPDGLVVVGEPYWIEPPPPGVSVPAVAGGDFESLVGTLDRVEAAGRSRGALRVDQRSSAQLRRCRAAAPRLGCVRSSSSLVP